MMPPPNKPAADVHERIQREAEDVRRLGACHYSEIEKRPALAALLQAAVQQIESAIPSTIVHEGETYYLCVRIAKLEIGIHATADNATPFVYFETEDGRWAGHALALKDRS